MKTLAALTLVIALNTLAMNAQQTENGTASSQAIVLCCDPSPAPQPTPSASQHEINSEDGTAANGETNSQKSTDLRIWAHAGVGLSSSVTAINGSMNVLVNSHLFTAFAGDMSYDNRTHTEIGLLYGIGGGEQWMYSIAGGLAYVEDAHYIASSEPPGYNDNRVRTIGVALQAHGSLDYYVAGLDLGMLACISTRSSAALTLGVNIGKLWK